MTPITNVFFFIPNLIGYVRILFAVLSFYNMPRSPIIASFAYVTSELLDAVDGFAARLLNQSSRFGAILDQLIDRCTFLGLLFVISQFYPSYVFIFQSVAVIDVACHWIHLHASLLKNNTSHKSGNTNPVLKVYYTNKWVLFALCAGNELFYLSLYLFHFFPENNKILGLVYVSAPLALAKTLISLIQGCVACEGIAAIDIQDRKINNFRNK